jgi:hypothetical protein
MDETNKAIPEDESNEESKTQTPQNEVINNQNQASINTTDLLMSQNLAESKLLATENI